MLVALLGAFAMSQGSCGRSDDAVTEPATANVPAIGVRVIPQVIQLSEIGETRQISGTVSPMNASDRRIIWESSDSLIASVDSLGRVTARGVGFGVFVTAFTLDRQHQASVNVSVVLSTPE